LPKEDEPSLFQGVKQAKNSATNDCPYIIASVTYTSISKKGLLYAVRGTASDALACHICSTGWCQLSCSLKDDLDGFCFGTKISIFDVRLRSSARKGTVSKRFQCTFSVFFTCYSCAVSLDLENESLALHLIVLLPRLRYLSSSTAMQSRILPSESKILQADPWFSFR
jgi:hypothetical protein